MKELSLNILDIAENSIKAGASITEITIIETTKSLTVSIIDNGCGMNSDMLSSVTDPFCTTRTTRKVGMGIPLMKLAAEQTGGCFGITSHPVDSWPRCHGTQVRAVFIKNHIDYTPLGDVISTVTTLIQGHPDTDFLFRHAYCKAKPVTLDTRELRAVLEDVPLNNYDVIKWIDGNLREQYSDNPTA